MIVSSQKASNTPESSINYIDRAFLFFLWNRNGTVISDSGCSCNKVIFSLKTCTYVQDWTQVLFYQYFIFGRVIWHFHITSYLTEFSVFWWLFTNKGTLWCQLWENWISLAFNPGHIWKSENVDLTVLSYIKNRKIQILKNTPVERWLHGCIMLFHQSN